jgi:hypothetical protein
LLLILLVTAPLHAEVVRVEVKSRTDILAGKSFGAVGSFEKLSGKIYFAINPKNSAKTIVRLSGRRQVGEERGAPGNA